MGVSSILWCIVCTCRVFCIDQLASASATECAGNGPKRDAYQYTDWACNRSTNGCTCSRACH